LFVLEGLKNQGYFIAILDFLSMLKRTRISAFGLLFFKNGIMIGLQNQVFWALLPLDKL